MDRTIRTDAAARTMRIDLSDADAFMPTSRRPLLDHARAALDAGPILVTGDAGVGKSWLINQLIGSLQPPAWLTVDLTPSDGPADLYRHLARGLGLTIRGAARLDILDVLADRSHDSERFGLVIDEAQNLGLDVWEEIRVLANRLGAADGFAYLILVGQTALVRQFSTRPMAALEARLAAHLHLRPLDLAEARGWLTGRHPEITWTDDEIEAIHRDSGGNPRRLLRRSATLGSRPRSRAILAPESSLTSQPQGVAALDSTPTLPMMNQAPLTGPARPPLHVEENSIEVGWSADETEAADFEEPERDANHLRLNGDAMAVEPPRVRKSEQAIHDHYAALQAWREWTTNQEKRSATAKSDRDLADAIDEAAQREATDSAEAATPDRPSLRAEGYQNFAPFGQLFTRMAPVREP